MKGKFYTSSKGIAACACQDKHTTCPVKQLVAFSPKTEWNTSDFPSSKFVKLGHDVCFNCDFAVYILPTYSPVPIHTRGNSSSRRYETYY
jgi:hypothetical protein